MYFVADFSQAEKVAQLPNVEVVLAPIGHYSLAEQSKLPQIFKAAKLDLLHVPHFNVPLLYSGPLIITIHDLLWHEYRGTQVTTLSASKYWLKYVAYHWVTTQAIKRAQKILVPTQVIKKTIAKYYPRDASKVTVTYEGVSRTLVKKRSAKQNLNLPKSSKILLYVGSLYPHKNVKLVIEALKQLPEYHLAVVGARNAFQNNLKKLVKQEQVESQVSFLGYLDDSQLADLMSKSEALVQPSLSEGFGLTGIEAMAANLPVIASQIPVFQEIYGKAALFFDPQSVTSFANAVHDLEKANRSHLQKAGLVQSQRYNWDTMAAQTLQEYRQVLA